MQAMAVPAGALSVQVKAVSCPTVTACTAVGEYVKPNSPQLTLAEYWDGSTWTVQSMPTVSPIASSVFLDGVSCPASGACTAVGWFQRSGTRALVTLAENNYSGSWRISSVRGPSATLGQLNGVSCTARANCAAVGSSNANGALAQHWDGTTWTAQATPSPAAVTLNGISCTSAANCTAVGSSGPVVDPAAAAERYYGGAWHREATASPAADEVLAGVSCVSASTCTAAGYHAVTSTTVQSPLAEQSSGS